MPISTITYSNKSDINVNSSVPSTNKVQATDMNEIKSVVNNNANLMGDVSTLSTGSPNVVSSINTISKYSTTEQRIGTWIDGKPIYRKVLEFNNVPTGLTQKNHGISNLDKLINYSGYYYNSTWGYNPIPAVPSDNISGYGIGIGDFKSTTFYFNIGNLRSSTNEIKLIVEYTKTTD